MRSFWTSGRQDEIERLLRANRSEPRDEFIVPLLSRLRPERRARDGYRFRGRVLAAVALTALTVSAAAFAGGARTAATSISGLVQVARKSVDGQVHVDKRTNDGNQDT